MPTPLFVTVILRLQDDAARVEDLIAIIMGLLREHYENYELILVDDGSQDETIALAKPLLQEYECIRLLRLSQRYGPDIAFLAALESTMGDYAVLLQAASDPPELIPVLVRLAQEQEAMVYGADWIRQDQRGLRRWGSALFYWSCSTLFQVSIPAHSTYLWALDRRAVNAILEIKNNFKYLKAMIATLGFKAIAVPYQPRQRSHPPRWPEILGAIDTAVSVITSNSLRPLRFVSLLSVGASALNLLYVFYVVAVLFFKKDVAEGWVTLSLQNSVMFLLLFSVLIVLSEYIGRILHEAKAFPLYYVQEEANSSVIIANPTHPNLFKGA